MTDRSPEVDSHSGVETTGHEWDGIKELNNPLPRWWLFVFYGCVVVAIAYWILMPAWPALPGLQGHTRGVLGQSDRVAVAGEMDALRASRAELSGKLAAMQAEDILKDHNLSQLALGLGESAFGDNCATCHGAGGRGNKGYPRLADDVWLWGGSLDEIEATIKHGIRSSDPATRTSQMPAYGRDQFRTAAQIGDLVEFVTMLSGREANAVAVERARPDFEAECSTCHGLDGKGDRSKGSANLTDTEWLYGGDKATIRQTIYGPRNGMMPNWSERLDPATVRALAIYVHTLGGGE